MSELILRGSAPGAGFAPVRGGAVSGWVRGVLAPGRELTLVPILTHPGADIGQVADVVGVVPAYRRPMPDYVTLDVIDRPPGGVRRAFGAIKSLRQADLPGMRGLVALRTGAFVPSGMPAPTMRRMAVLAAWDAPDAVDPRWPGTLDEIGSEAGEHWHLEAELARAAFSAPWRGWMPDIDGARQLDDDEPAVILISGDLRARYAPAFYWNGVAAVRQAARQPGYLGGLFVTSSPLNTTSCSCWRTYADARAYAFGPGGHRVAMRRDRKGAHHSREYFMRLRPLVERGSLAGAAPLADVLAARRVAA